jgi:hypothetical protein
MDSTMDGIGEIEQEYPNHYRECCQSLFPVLWYILAKMPDTIDKWGIAFAVNSPETAGRSMADIAASLGVSRAALSHKAKEFCDDNGLSYTPKMKHPAS